MEKLVGLGVPTSEPDMANNKNHTYVLLVVMLARRFNKIAYIVSSDTSLVVHVPCNLGFNGSIHLSDHSYSLDNLCGLTIVILDLEENFLLVTSFTNMEKCVWVHKFFLHIPPCLFGMCLLASSLP